MSNHLALWLNAKRGDFEVGPAPVATPGSGEILVRTRAIAVNPFEPVIRVLGDLLTPWVQYPAILGTDVAGDVIAVGDGVTRFAVGDRAVGFAVGVEKGFDSSKSAFQSQVVLLERLSAPLPDEVSCEAASAIPLGLMTAAAGLFQDDFLGMQMPSARPKPMGKTLLVWGGSTSVGCNAIQLAVAAGYDVVATASLHNAEYLRGLGVRRVFDRNSPTVIREVIADLKGREISGALAIGQGSTRSCIDIVAACRGNRFVAITSAPVTLDDIPAGSGRWRKLYPRFALMMMRNVALMLRGRRKGVRSKFIWGGSPAHNDLGPMLWREFLPGALAEGRFVPAPDAQVVGSGLDQIRVAFERQGRGVSAKKLVVTL